MRGWRHDDDDPQAPLLDVVARRRSQRWSRQSHPASSSPHPPYDPLRLPQQLGLYVGLLARQAPAHQRLRGRGRAAQAAAVQRRTPRVPPSQCPTACQPPAPPAHPEGQLGPRLGELGQHAARADHGVDAGVLGQELCARGRGTGGREASFKPLPLPAAMPRACGRTCSKAAACDSNLCQRTLDGPLDGGHPVHICVADGHLRQPGNSSTFCDAERPSHRRHHSRV